MKLAFYDMDLTILGRPSWTAWLLHYARRHAPARLLAWPAALAPVAAYGLGGLDRGGLKEATHRLMLGRRAPRLLVEEAAADFAARFGTAQERVAALDRMEAERRDGWRLVLATASSRHYVEAFARRWGVADVIATEHVWVGDCLTPALAGENCYGPAKRRAVEQWLEAGGIDRRAARLRVYSDHVSDLPFLELADEPFAVSPSPQLAEAAQRRGWPILDWG